MKKLVVLAAIAALVGCSKESELNLHESAKDNVVMSSDGSFDVGTVDSDGITTITYDEAELKELCACAVSEDNATDLRIEAMGSSFYLSGYGQSTGSYTTFAILLSQDGSTLSWDENASILTCETTASEPCSIDVFGYENHDCSNDVGSCGENLLGGTNGAAYADCEFPWLVTKKSGK
ncbi:MAG: hypothetical protein WEC59_01575 [Salibacteraceae bacterium]